MPLTLAALGIVLRGSSFAFRKEVFRTSSRRNFGAAFAFSSVLVPYCMGAVAGAIASGRVPAGGKAGDPWDSWINPTSILGGVLAVTVCAYLAAVYLVWDARSPRRRARWSSTTGSARSVRRSWRVSSRSCGIFVLHDDAKYVFDGLTSRALPLVIISALCGIGCLVLLVRDEHRGARLLAMGAVATVVVAWGVAQWPYLLPTSLKVSQAAAPDATLATILVVFVIAAVVILPSLGLLYVLDQRSLLQIEVVEEDVAQTEG